MSVITFQQLDISDINKIREIEGIIGITIDINKEDNSNEFDKYIYTEKDNQIGSIFLIQCLRDIKTCNVIWLNADLSKKSLIKDATNYALEILGMEEAFINVANNNPNLIKYLEKNGFESLGEEDGNIIFLKEKTEELSQDISDKIEDVAMKKASEMIRYNRKRRIKKLRLKRNKERRLLAKRAEQRKELIDFIEKIRYQSTLLKNKVKCEKKRIENMFDEKIKQVKKLSKERTDIIKERLKKKSILYKRIVDAYPNFELLMKMKLYLDKKELKKKEKENALKNKIK